MQTWLIAVFVTLCSFGTAGAQTALSPAMGATSPLGTLSSNGTSGASISTIPLGSTELSPGGLSPALGSNCTVNVQPFVSSSTSSTTTTSSTFDGGGMLENGSADPTAGCTSSSTNATSSQPFTSGLNSTFALDGGRIPLGSTETNGGGLSPTTMVPGPTITPLTSGNTASPCTGSSMNASSFAGSGSSSLSSSAGC